MHVCWDSDKSAGILVHCCRSETGALMCRCAFADVGVVASGYGVNRGLKKCMGQARCCAGVICANFFTFYVHYDSLTITYFVCNCQGGYNAIVCIHLQVHALFAVGYLVVNWACRESNGIEQGAALRSLDRGVVGVIKE